MRRNAALFIAFRVLFNARFYYPVFAVFFLDLGLSLAEFAAANALWAAAIVGLEVPSGALADLAGRKRMLVLGAALMILEMLLLCLAPVGGGMLLLGAVLLNRILSGAAEACCSGADEALAYDSLRAEGRESGWPHLLERVMRWQSVGFICSSVIGAAVYDPALLGRVLPVSDPETVRAIALRLPVFLNLLMACGALAVALAMREPPGRQRAKIGVGETWRQMAKAAAWIMASRPALALILTGLAVDSAVRVILTITSTYYRLIQIPDSLFGVLGSLFALLGFITAPIGRRLVARYSTEGYAALVIALVLGGLIGVAAAVPRVGFVFLLVLGLAFFLNNFLLSERLHAWVDSGQRATVMSFKNLAMNIAYGLLSLSFGALVNFYPSADGSGSLGRALPALPIGFFVAACGLLLLNRRLMRRA